MFSLKVMARSGLESQNLLSWKLESDLKGKGMGRGEDSLHNSAEQQMEEELDEEAVDRWPYSDLKVLYGSAPRVVLFPLCSKDFKREELVRTSGQNPIHFPICNLPSTTANYFFL